MKTILSSLLVGLVLVATPAWTRADEASGVSIQKSDDHVDFLVGKELFTRYQMGPNVSKPYFWPVNAAGGVPVTRGWPLEDKESGGSDDHIHQKSAWFCHGDVIPEGIEVKEKIKGVIGVDFWSENKGHGRVVCTHVGEPTIDKNHAQVTTKNEWRTKGGDKILDETRTIYLHEHGSARLLVLDIDLFASVVPLAFGDTKEGSCGVRVNDAIREGKGGKIENADGKVGEKECWGQHSNWCDYSGPIDGKVAGIAILDAPLNSSRACWHSRAYGLMAANPFGRDSFPATSKEKKELVKLAKGEHLKLRYGILVHLGDAKEGKVAEIYEKFAAGKE